MSAVPADSDSIVYCDSVSGDPVGYVRVFVDPISGLVKSEITDLDNTVLPSVPGTWEICCCSTGGGVAPVIDCEVIQDCVGQMLNADGFTYNDVANRFDTTGVLGSTLVTNGVGGATWEGAEALRVVSDSRASTPPSVYTPVTVTGPLATLTNPSANKQMMVLYTDTTDVAMTMGYGNAMLGQFTFEWSINGGAFFVAGSDRMGMNSVGTTVAVANMNNYYAGMGLIQTPVILAPGGSITLQSRSTMQVLNGLANPIGITGGCALTAWGFYI